MGARSGPIDRLLELTPAPLHQFVRAAVGAIAEAAALELDRRLGGGPSPWVDTEGAVAYTQMPAGTFAERVARGVIPVHRHGKRNYFRRDELDEYMDRGSA